MQSTGFDPDFLAKYSKAKYDAILATSEAACKDGWIAPDRAPDSNDNPRRTVNASTAASAAGLSVHTATGVKQLQASNQAADRDAEQAASQVDAAQPMQQHSQSRSNEPSEPAHQHRVARANNDTQGRQSQSSSTDIEAKARETATEQVQNACNLSAAPTDAGYRYLYDLEVNRRTKQILKNLSRRHAQRENRKSTIQIQINKTCFGPSV